MANKVFSVAVFFVVFRECLEAVVIISVLLSFLDQSIGSKDPLLLRKLRKQVWIGVALGFIICLAIGCGFIGAYYSLQKDIFGSAEDLWEAIFCLIATVMITMMGIPMLRMNKMQSKWRVKIAKSLVEIPARKRDRFKLGYLTSRYAMFLLPFITVLRDGLEAVVFVAGAGVTTQGSQASAYPLPVFVGLLAGGFVGWLLYYGASRSSLQVFLIISTSILYLISAGLFSRGAWFLENYRFNIATGGDASEGGNGNGTYNIKKAVYHVNCCNPELDNGWDIFNALLGWQNTGYLSSVLAYNIYWIVLMIFLGLLMFEEKNGHLPGTKNLHLRQLNPGYWIKNKKKNEMTKDETDDLFNNLGKLRFTADGGIDRSEGAVVDEVEDLDDEQLQKPQMPEHTVDSQESSSQGTVSSNNPPQK